MTTDLKTLRSVAEGAKDRPYTGYVPEDAWHVDPHESENVIIYGQYEKHGRAYHGVIDGAFNAAVALHIATFDPPTALSLLDRVEAAEAMAKTVRTLEAERDRLREALEPFAKLGGPIDGENGRPTYVEALNRDGTGELHVHSPFSNRKSVEALWVADFITAYAALNPSGVEGEAG